jgi:hypothetical protein
LDQSFGFDGSAEGTLTRDDAVFTISGTTELEGPDLAVAFIGDRDGDLTDDIAVSHDQCRVPADGRDEPTYCGAIFVFSGPLSGDLTLDDADEMITSTGPTDQTFGASIGRVGDLDLDGHAEVFASVGEVCSRANMGMHQLSPGDPGLPALRFTTSSDCEGGAAFGGGDFDGDGYPDTIAAVPGSNGYVNYGAVHLLRGPVTAGLDFLVEGGDLNWEVPDRGTQFGLGVALTDLDGDGLDDLAVGEPWGRTSAQGVVYLFPGRSSP